MRNLSKLILSLLLAFFGLSFSHDLNKYNLNKLDPVLRMAVREDKKALEKSRLKVKSYEKEIRKVKVLTKDGKVMVVDLSKRNLKSLLLDDNIIYIEAPRKLKPKADITFKSSYVVWGAGNQEVQVNYPAPFFGYIVGGSITAPGCQVHGPYYTYFTCSSNAKISITAPGNYRLILSGDSLNASHITGGNAKYLVGTRASQSGKTGRGVIVGIIDTGINFCHPAFRKEDGTTRILYFKSYNGTELNSNQINQRIANGDCNYDYHPDPNASGHGTAVASVAGGYWARSRFNSQASDVSFIIYQTSFEDTDIIDALDYIKAKAQSLNMPAVVNMSLGTHYGPHDWTGLWDKKVDEVSGSGFIVVVSAGNEGDRKIHAQITSGSVDLELTEEIDNNIYGVDIDGWYTAGSTYKVSVCNQAQTSCVRAEPRQAKSGSLASCSVEIDNSVLSSPLNGDGNVFISLQCSNPEKLKLKFERLSGDGKIDLWIATENEDFANGYVEDGFGGYKYTIVSPGTAKKAITVGAIGGYPRNFIDFLIYPNDFGCIAHFSSRGPTRDGRIKPEIVANGFDVCAANYIFSPNADPNTCGNKGENTYYVAVPGTSLSAPVVSALVALYLQDNPTATPEEVKAWLMNNAVYDVEGSRPNMAYGWGKAVWPEGQVPPPTNPAPPIRDGGSGGSGGGGGGCSMGYASPVNALAWLVVVVAVMVRRRLYR